MYKQINLIFCFLFKWVNERKVNLESDPNINNQKVGVFIWIKKFWKNQSISSWWQTFNHHIKLSMEAHTMTQWIGMKSFFVSVIFFISKEQTTSAWVKNRCKSSAASTDRCSKWPRTSGRSGRQIVYVCVCLCVQFQQKCYKNWFNKV